MLYRQIGSSDLQVSEICLGSWLTYGGAVAQETAVACVDAAFDAGINFIDTANVYSGGKAESFLGEVLAGRPRDSYILATKVFGRMSPTDHGLSREQILKQVDASLERLQMDYIDLYQCHRYDWDTPLDETMEALTEVVRQGKARYIGFSEWPAERIQAALDMPGMEKFVSSQPQYSLIWRGPERDVIPLSRENGISQIPFSPLSQGVLTGKYKPGESAPEGTRMTTPGMNMWMGDDRYPEELLARVQQLVPLAEGLGLTLSQLALAWILREPNVASPIIGASRPAQVAENAAASGVTLDAETLARIDEILDGSISYEGPES
jgi:aryl-alcohol dehydrogenase-like predicted oxidoreductase